MAKQNWVIEHDNGQKNIHGFSDGYESEEETKKEIEEMERRGITVYQYWRSE